ncbi:MAG: hypothetical protein RL062_774 [Bacteroidota bacterium]
MRIHYTLQTLPPHIQTFVTVGTFDGVHLGHAAMLRNMVDQAKQVNAQTVVLSFHPHPKKVLFPESDPLPQIQSMEEKIASLTALGIDHFVLLDFTLEMAQLSAQEYVNKVIVEGLHTTCLYMGYDHRFGKNRVGDIQLMRYLGEIHGFEVVQIPAIQIGDITVSSTKVRAAIAAGEIVEANIMLDRPFEISGEVIHGHQLGRKLGFPTANLSVSGEDKILPAPGVYAATWRESGKIHPVALNIGYRPTVNTAPTLQVEAYILDWSGDLYGKSITLEIHERLRGELKFNGLDALVQKIQEDVEWIKNWFSSFVA